MQLAPLERRVQRSDHPLEALACWLEASRRRARLRSLALADGSGLLLAGAGVSNECDELAAWAPLRAAEGRASEGASATISVKVDGLDAYLCARGDACPEADWLRDAARGCVRILNAA